MTSGVKVHDDVTRDFNEIKVKPSSQDASEHLRILTLIIEDGLIVVGEKIRQGALEGQNVLNFLRSKLNLSSCCYMLYDCRYQTSESPKSELVFISWTPTDGCIKDRMLYSSSKSAITKVFTGVKHNFEFHDYDDLDELPSKVGNDVVSIEGNPV